MTWRKTLFLVAVAAIAFLVIAFLAMLRYGFSAHHKPTGIEVTVARIHLCAEGALAFSVIAVT